MRKAIGGVVLATALVVTMVAWVLRVDDDPGASAARSPSASATPSPSTSAEPPKQVAPEGATLVPPPKPACPPVRPIRPVRLAIEHVSRNAPVLALPRDANNVPGVPPVSGSGKRTFGWDAPGLRPGAPRGNAIMTAHTYPDGSAIGNTLLNRLQEGDRLTVYGAGKAKLCYRIFDRVEIPFTASGARFYDDDGPHDLVIIVCSGRRLGPGVWTHRTLWYARPMRQTA